MVKTPKKQIILGIDTGGTTTNAVLYDAGSRTVIKSATARTTHRALVICIDEVLNQFSPLQLATVRRVCLSTTLATNAVLEDNLSPVVLLTSGRDYPHRFQHVQHFKVSGELNIKGEEIVPVDLSALDALIDFFKPSVQAIAVSGFASIKNPMHELSIKAHLSKSCSLPILCAHE